VVGDFVLHTCGSSNSCNFRSLSSGVLLVLRASGEFPSGRDFFPTPASSRASGRFMSWPLIARPLGKLSKIVDFRCPPMSRASGIIGFGRLRSGSGGFPCWRASRPTPASLRASGGGLCASPPSRASGGGLCASPPSRASGGGLCASPTSRASGGCLCAKYQVPSTKYS
jgi:hypothetical protein